MIKNVYVVLFCLVSTAGFSQSKRGNIAVFGDLQAIALNFNKSPVAVSILPAPGNVIFRTEEGSASICDNDGKLLFYTNGVAVWTRDHVLMPNGGGLTGQNSSTSATQVLIIPFPKDPFLYYIVSAQPQGRSLCYSLVDIRLNGGKGDVIDKAIVLNEKSTEKLCVIPQASGEALWLVTHEFGTDRFKSFLIDENGLNADPVITAIGNVHSTELNLIDGTWVAGSNAIGYMKASQDGTRIAVAVSGTMGTLELFSFDSATGVPYNPINLFDTPKKWAYGVEFSPDGSKLYLSLTKFDSSLFQYDLSSYSKEDILASEVELYSGRPGGAVQLGPDGRIYRVGGVFHPFLDVIENPNAPGVDCHFVKDKISLLEFPVWLGLPELIYHSVDPEIVYDKYCETEEIKFNLIKIKEYKSISWDFGDPASGSLNVSSSVSPVHQYMASGTYVITVKVLFNDNSEFNYTQPIRVKAYPALDLGKDTLICPAEQFTISAATNVGAESIVWSDGAYGFTKSTSSPGTYWATAKTTYCQTTDTITIKRLLPPSFSIHDTTLCHYDVLQIALSEAYSYIWNDGFVGNERKIENPDEFYVIGSNRCGSHAEDFLVKFLTKLEVEFGPDTMLCKGQKLALDATNPSAEYQWQDKSQDPKFLVTVPGEYFVEVYNRCEMVSDSIKVDFISDSGFFVPNIITPNDDENNDVLILDPELHNPSLIIYNRWGQKVYSSPKYENNWGGGNLDTGVYYYFIQQPCAKTELKGPIHIMR
jgi:WD40 repeat protein